MKLQKYLVRIGITLLLTAFAPLTLAQADVKPEFKMPCPDVLKLGLSDFVDLYGDQTQDFSTYGMKMAYAYYAECKRPMNDLAAKRLGEAKVKLVNSVREELANVGNAAWEMTYMAAGGGTMYSLMSVAAYGAREDFMAAFIGALGNDKRQPASRRKANLNLAKSRRSITEWSKIPKMEVYGDERLADKQKIYRDAFKKAQAAAARLRVIIGKLPDAAAQRASARLAEELETELD